MADYSKIAIHNIPGDNSNSFSHGLYYDSTNIYMSVCSNDNNAGGGPHGEIYKLVSTSLEKSTCTRLIANGNSFGMQMITGYSSWIYVPYGISIVGTQWVMLSQLNKSNLSLVEEKTLQIDASPQGVIAADDSLGSHCIYNVAPSKFNIFN